MWQRNQLDGISGFERYQIAIEKLHAQIFFQRLQNPNGTVDGTSAGAFVRFIGREDYKLAVFNRE
jgi:hypothetical protein